MRNMRMGSSNALPENGGKKLQEKKLQEKNCACHFGVCNILLKKNFYLKKKTTLEDKKMQKKNSTRFLKQKKTSKTATKEFKTYRVQNTAKKSRW